MLRRLVPEKVPRSLDSEKPAHNSKTPLPQATPCLSGRQLCGPPVRITQHLSSEGEPQPTHSRPRSRRPHAQGHPQDDDSPAPPGCDAASCAATSSPPQKHPAAPRGPHEEYDEPRVPVSPGEQYLSPRSLQPRSCPSGPAKHRSAQLGRTPPLTVCVSSVPRVHSVTSHPEEGSQS